MRRIQLGPLVVAFLAGLLVPPVRHVTAAILAGVVWAILAWPVFRVARRRLRGPAAAVTTLAATALVVLAPVALLGGLVAGDLRDVGLQPPASWSLALAGLPGGSAALVLAAKVGAALPARMASAGVLSLMQLPLTLAVAYQGLRRGPRLWLAFTASRKVPAARALAWSQRATTVLRAVARGQVLTAVCKGAVGALGFWIAGVPGVALWGCAMALFTFLPVLTAWMVWMPAALWLASTGRPEAAAFLAAWGALVIGLLDNLVRPLLVGKQARIDPVLAMAAMALGVAAFGLVGLVAGPVLLDLALGFNAAKVTRAPAPATPPPAMPSPSIPAPSMPTNRPSRLRGLRPTLLRRPLPTAKTGSHLKPVVTLAPKPAPAARGPLAPLLGVRRRNPVRDD